MQLVLANSEGECGCMHAVHCSHQGGPNDSPRFVCSATHHHHHSMDLSGRAAYGMARQGSPPSCCEIECHFKGTARTHSPLSLRFSTDPIRAEAGRVGTVEEVQGAFAADGHLTFLSSSPRFHLTPPPAPCLVPRESAASTAADCTRSVHTEIRMC